MAKPLHSSPIPAKSVGKVPEVGLTGTGFLGWDPVPVQIEVWRLLEARRNGLPVYENGVVEVPRRSGKTGALLSLAVGRCASIPGYQATYCAQSGIQSRRRFYEVYRAMSRHAPGGWRQRESRGEESIQWGNDSILDFRPPKASGFRGDAQDLLVLDEAQEVDEEDAADLIGSVMPVFDTRPGAQLVVAGTAGDSRSGLLWQALTDGRTGKWGIIEYAAAEGADPEDERVWLSVHPGPVGASKGRTLEVLRKRRKGMTLEAFGREYLGIWPDEATAAGFTVDTWQQLGTELAVPFPSRVGIGFDVAPEGGYPAVMVAWRGDDGTAYVELTEVRTAEQIAGLAKKFRVPVGYDPMSVGSALLADEIARRYRSVTLRAFTTLEVATSCAAVSAEVTGATLRHFRQQALDSAVEVARRRPVKDAGWLWGRKASTGSIAPLVAATVALRMFDDLPEKRPLRVLTASA